MLIDQRPSTDLFRITDIGLISKGKREFHIEGISGRNRDPRPLEYEPPCVYEEAPNLNIAIGKLDDFRSTFLKYMLKML